MRFLRHVAVVMIMVMASLLVPVDASSTAGVDRAQAEEANPDTSTADAEHTESAVTPTSDSVPAATGPLPKVTSVMTPPGVQTSGTSRTFTLTYKNEGTAQIKNGRFWQQFMVRAAHTTTYTVSCAAAGGAICPADLPVGQQTINGLDHQYDNTFASVADLPAGGQFIFTVTAKTILNTNPNDGGICADTSTVMTGGWARFSRTGFTMPDDIDASASSVGYTLGADVCADGDIKMTNTVTTPGPADSPSKVLSGDTRTFSVTWKNITGSTMTDVPLAYTYYVPYTGQVTEASWTCTTATGVCPTWASGSATVNHDNAGEDPDQVFGGNATLLAGQTLTMTVSLATTINTCTQDGYLRVQSYATLGAGQTGETGFRQSVPSQLVEIGCSTWLLSENFSGTSVADSGWKGLNETCLTRATVTASNGLGKCNNRTRVPETSFTDSSGKAKGYLKLTDDSGGRVGAALYDRALPSKNGLVLEFNQYQYGDNNLHADGIGFFLANGASTLSQAGQTGGALGYSNRGTSAGLANAYLGVGFDAFGNFADTAGDNAQQCGTSTYHRKPNSVTLRGPGNGSTGYCAVGATNQLSGKSLYASYLSASMSTTLANAQRKTRVTVYPLADGQTAPRVTVEIDFGEGYYTTVLDRTMTEAAPQLIKFGFLASTGGARDAHLIDSLKVGTVLPMQALDLVKVVDKDKTSQESFSVGDKIPYKLVVTNTSTNPIYQMQVTDPLVDAGSLTCPAATTIPASGSATCTAVHTVTSADRDAGHLLNTATARASTSDSGNRNLTATASVDATVNPQADDASRVIQPGGTATFQVVDNGTTPGIVRPDDPSKIAIKLIDPATGQPTDSTLITAAGQGTWALDRAINVVTFKPITDSYAGTVTPLKYQATNTYGGSAQAHLSVTINVAPLKMCTADEQRASDRFWAFGNTAEVDFGVQGSAVQTGVFAGVSGSRGTFVATDSAGTLQFVVDGGANGTILNRNGATMFTGLGTSADAAQQVTAFPDAQGSGRYYVVWSTARSTTAGQLKYIKVDMTLNGGLGGVIGLGATTLGAAIASSAVTAVPNADGTGYWVVSPDKTGNGIHAFPFTAMGVGTGIKSNAGTAAIADGATSIPTSYEDIRFSPDLTQVATMASSSSEVNRIRLLAFNAATGTFTNRYEWTMPVADSAYGYNVEFSPNAQYLYASRIGSSGAVYRYTLGTGGASGQASVGASVASSGMIRLGPDGRLYWAQNGQGALRILTNPDSTGESFTISLTLAGSAKSGYGLPQTLADCAISPSGFGVQKLGESEGNSQPVDGADFALYPDDGGHAGETPVSADITPVDGQAGAFTIDGLAPGRYWLRETKAPAGYSLLADDVRVDVALRGAVTVQTVGNPQVGIAQNGSRYTISVTDNRTIVLPLTGGQWTLLLLIAGVLFVGIALAGSTWWRRRQMRFGLTTAGEAPASRASERIEKRGES